MTAYEMMLSESQERMLLVVKKGQEQEIFDIFAKHDVDAVAIGEVIEEKAFRIEHEGEICADIPVDTLAKEAPVYHLPSKEAAYYQEFPKAWKISTSSRRLQRNVKTIITAADDCKQGMGIQAI